MADSADFEKRGVFYLGKTFDLDAAKVVDPLVLYESKDLTTHGVCVGMTGSGKTGLCLALLEEAAIDGVPAIAIDPKGDLGNLLLTFPDLLPTDFQPWIDPAEAERKGVSVDALAAKTAETWKNGLAQWGEDGARIQKFKDAVDISIYTPGSTAGLPLSVLKSFDAPDAAIRDDAEALRDRIGSSVSGLLALLGIDADPLRSREHILISNLLNHAWLAGRNLDLGSLIDEIDEPSLDKIGDVPLESFYPRKERKKLSMKINNLLASPGFSAWMEGEPLDVQRLLYTAEGKPRLSIISIAHLSDAERMFFVTLLLGEIIAWMRGQSGTSSLRAMLYMDEVFGYFPPSANPPTKTPMLTLLKQARAYGLGVMLATQNPVDLDYKGLSNAGTWFLGRLQTERDKLRVLDGLEGASAAAGTRFDRSKMEKILSSLDSRVFLMNNVHDDQPVVMQSRWALSYLRGPLTREQIAELMADRKTPAITKSDGPEPTSETKVVTPVRSRRPKVPEEVGQAFLCCKLGSAVDQTIKYRPALYGAANIHFINRDDKFDCWQPHTFVMELASGEPAQNWSGCQVIVGDLSGVKSEAQDSTAEFDDLPSSLWEPKVFRPLKGELKDFIYQTVRLELKKCELLGVVSKPGESAEEFQHALIRAATEKQQAELTVLEESHNWEIERLTDEKLRAPSAFWLVTKRVFRQMGVFLMGLVTVIPELVMRLADLYFNKGRRYRKILTQRQMGQIASAAKRSGGANKGEPEERTRGDIEAEIDSLNDKFHRDKEDLEKKYDPAKQVVTVISAQPRKSDIDVNEVQILWLPYKKAADGTINQAFDLNC